MAYKRAELVLHDSGTAKVIAWCELPEEETQRMAGVIDDYFKYVAKVTHLPEGARFKVRFDYMANLIPKRPRV